MGSCYDSAQPELVGWPIPFGFGQPEATVLTTGTSLVLIYPTSTKNLWAVLTFEMPKSVRYGTPNSSELDSHPLSGRVEVGDLYVIHESPWWHEARAMNAVHPQFDPSHWSGVKHFFAFLWNYTFECLAVGILARTISGKYSDVVSRIASDPRSP